MKGSSQNRNYYDEYLEVCYSISPKRLSLDLHKLVKQDLLQGYFISPFGTCLIDYSSGKYTYLSEQIQDILGYSKEEYLQGGLRYHARNFNPEDRSLYTDVVFKDIREFWKKIPLHELFRYRFSFNHRYKRKDGTFSQLLQQGFYLEPQPEGVPVLNLLTFNDIGDYKTDTNLVLTISRYSNSSGFEKVFTKTYCHAKKSMISAREAEILRLSLDGLSSKMIADKLFISIQTVKNHKKNMMDKTSAKNIAELISISLKNKWI
jgi:DNA-binding CsgD family transcriptional regulator